MTTRDEMIVEFWGVRGTLPVSGEKSLRYGGNTNCVTLKIADKHFFIFDAGSGIKELSSYIIKNSQHPFTAKIFISHPHYDHINALPFFAPLFVKGNRFEIFGAKQGDKGIQEVLAGTLDGIYMPITLENFAADLQFHDLGEEDLQIEDVQVQTLFLNHPGKCLGYRVQYQNKVFCYITDNELFLEDSEHYAQEKVDRLQHFVREADALVIDTTYSDAEYQQKVGWGHSCVSQVAKLADLAQVKLLCLYHHDPEQADQDIDNKLEQARSILKERHSKTECLAPMEGERYSI